VNLALVDWHICPAEAVLKEKTLRKLNLIFLGLVIGAAACSSTSSEETVSSDAEVTIVETSTSEAPASMGMGRGSSMMERHRAPIPSEYADSANPVAADEQSITRGSELYITHCATCHGDGGMGDGPSGEALEPAPAPIAHTSQMMGDDYLFYRISEGGAFEPFSSSMPAWKSILDESERWDVINYVRALGSGQITPGMQMGGAAFDPEAEAANHEAMADQGVDEGVITREEADTFLKVHAEIDKLMIGDIDRSGGMDDIQSAMLEELLANERITKKEADIFVKVHETLLAAGIME